MTYTEEREFTVRLLMRCEFPQDYQGEQDGYEWARETPQLAGELLRAVVGVLGNHPGWRLRSGNRGLPSTDEVTLILDKILPQTKEP